MREQPEHRSGNGEAVGAQDLVFTPGTEWPDELSIDIGTAGSTTLVVLETGLILGAVLAVAFRKLDVAAGDLLPSADILLRAVIVAFACQLCLYYGELYDDSRLTSDRRELLARVMQALGATSLIVSLVILGLT